MHLREARLIAGDHLDEGVVTNVLKGAAKLGGKAAWWATKKTAKLGAKAAVAGSKAAVRGGKAYLKSRAAEKARGQKLRKRTTAAPVKHGPVQQKPKKVSRKVNIPAAQRQKVQAARGRALAARATGKPRMVKKKTAPSTPRPAPKAKPTGQRRSVKPSRQKMKPRAVQKSMQAVAQRPVPSLRRS